MDNKKKEKSEGEKLAEKLLSDKKNGGLRLSEEKIKKADTPYIFTNCHCDFLLL